MIFLRTMVILLLAACTHADDARIPPGVDLHAHHLSLNIDPSDYEFNGVSDMQIEVHTPTNTLYFHALGLNLGDTQLLKDETTIELKVKTNEYGRVSAHAEQDIHAGFYTLSVGFTATYDRRGMGIYKVEQGGNAMVFTQMEPEFARRSIPCFDEPQFKVPWTLSLHVPARNVALANAPVDREEAGHVYFKPTPPLPSYLLAFAVGPFEKVDVEGLGVPGHIVCPPGQSNLTHLAASMTPPILRAMEHYFGSPYPYQKLDQIAVPEFNFGAMENPGLVTYRDTILLTDTNAVSSRQKQGLAKIIAHELAHMWFGNLVTPKWWNDLWLNESFASWMAQKIAEDVFPDFEFGTQDIDAKRRAMKADALPSAYAIRRNVDGPYDKTTLFDALSYSKGMAILNMLENWIGADQFQKGMARYAKKYAWKNTDAFDLARALEGAGAREITPVMRAFTTQPGIPLIEIQKISDNQIRIKQSRYRVLSDRSAYPQTWPIPITLDLNTGSQRISQRVLLDKEQTVINLQLPFSLTRYGTFYPNAGERGYYRWVLKDFPPPHLARLQIREQLGYLDNLEASLQAGAIKPVDFFNQLKSFAMVQHPEVLRRLAQSLSSAKNDLIDDSMTAGFAAYVEDLLLPGLDTIGWEAKTGDGPQTHRARASLFEALGFLSENSPVLERARQKVFIYQQAPDAVDPNLAATWIKLAAIRGDRILFQNYQEHFESEENPVIQQYYLNGLGYFRDKDIALEALAYSLTDDVKPQEWGRIPFTLANHPPLHTTVFDWYKSYYETIRSKVPDHYLHWHVWICAKRDLDVLEQGRRFFLHADRVNQGIRIEYQKVEEVVQQRLALYESDQTALQKYFLP